MLFNVANLLVLLGVFYGLYVRRNVTLHVRVMKTCFVLDVLLLLAVEVGRGAIEKTLGIERMPEDINMTMLAIHIPLAVLSMVFWIVQLVYGQRILRGRSELLPTHRRNALVFMVFRVGNLVTAVLLHV